MSLQSKRELLAQIAPRYRDATHAQKTQILDAFVAATGYARKYAIRLLTQPQLPLAVPTRSRKPRYGPAVQEALIIAWLAANAICAKRLVPFLPVLVPQLERHDHLHLTDAVRTAVLTLSPATADRLLRTARADHHLRGKSTTKAGTLLKKQIPIRTFQDWNDLAPGFVEADLVAHCGGATDGAFLCTLTVTDVATGWVECQALILRSQHTVIQAMERVRQLLPFPLLGVDTDNGSEFINAGLLGWCADAQVTFTRGRTGKSNDQCFVEQKNGAVVRQIIGYDRFEGEAAYQQLAELYRAVRLYVNLFQPSVKLQTKTRDGARTTRRYDQAQTPLQRVMASAVLTADQQVYLEQLFATLDPVHLLRQISLLQDALWRHAVVASTPVTPPALPPAALAFAQTHGLGPHAHAPTGGLGLDSTTLPKARASHRSTSPQPRLHRTRIDPFAAVWEEVWAWLSAQPERTAKSVFQDLQHRYPGQFPDGQLRTLQRRVGHPLGEWRAQALLRFDDQWLQQDAFAALPPRLRMELGRRLVPAEAEPVG
ncbi:MAG: transposase family protein [Herpetosiphonaceae bacterium]|nr:transposase family protein [Herpetosiphonaceae bacterium]